MQDGEETVLPESPLPPEECVVGTDGKDFLPESPLPPEECVVETDNFTLVGSEEAHGEIPTKAQSQVSCC